MALFFAGGAAVLHLGKQSRILRVWRAFLLALDGAMQIEVTPERAEVSQRLVQHQ